MNTTDTTPDVGLLRIVADSNLILTVDCHTIGFCVVSADDPSTQYYYDGGEWHPNAPAIDPTVLTALTENAGELEELLRSIGAWSCGCQVGLSPAQLAEIY
jgi:hypothetical protein